LVDGTSTARRTRGTAMRSGALAPRRAVLDSEPSRRSTVMRLYAPAQPADIRVTRRRSDLVPSTPIWNPCRRAATGTRPST
jgi:hypothetical protein